jgi:hypothetical protein
MTDEQAILERMAAQVAELLELTEQMRADVREMHGMMDRIEAHMQRIDEILKGAPGRSGGSDTEADQWR